MDSQIARDQLEKEFCMADEACWRILFHSFRHTVEGGWVTFSRLPIESIFEEPNLVAETFPSTLSKVVGSS